MNIRSCYERTTSVQSRARGIRRARVKLPAPFEILESRALFSAALFPVHSPTSKLPVFVSYDRLAAAAAPITNAKGIIFRQIVDIPGPMPPATDIGAFYSNAPASAFLVTVQWGDHTTSRAELLAGTTPSIALSGGGVPETPLFVVANHAYHATGTFQVTISIAQQFHFAQSTFTIASTAVVIPKPATGGMVPT